VSKASQIASKGRVGVPSAVEIASGGRILGIGNLLEVLAYWLTLPLRPIHLALNHRSIGLSLQAIALSLRVVARDAVANLFKKVLPTLPVIEELKLVDRSIVLSLLPRELSLEGDYSMSSNREFIESQDSNLEIGENEAVEFPFNIPESWQSDPHSPDTPTFVLENEAGDDVTGTFASGDPTVVAGKYTSPLLSGLTKGEVYKMICGWDDSPNTLEAFGWLRCT